VQKFKKLRLSFVSKTQLLAVKNDKKRADKPKIFKQL